MDEQPHRASRAILAQHAGIHQWFRRVSAARHTVPRDAIGARVRVTTQYQGQTSQSIQTLRAGEGYLAQSSKWLHFGLGPAEITKVHVRWPNGVEQSWGTLTPNRRYLIVEGGQPQAVAARGDVPLAGSVPLESADVTPETLRIIPHRRLPMPVIRVFDAQLKTATLEWQESRATLVSLWATWCQPCLAELKNFQAHQEELTQQYIRWVPLNSG